MVGSVITDQLAPRAAKMRNTSHQQMKGEKTKSRYTIYVLIPLDC
jgi:hypothetical protein